MPSRDVETWAARRIVAMHDLVDPDRGLTGRCKTCPPDRPAIEGGEVSCYMLGWARRILATELAAVGLPHPQT